MRAEKFINAAGTCGHGQCPGSSLLHIFLKTVVDFYIEIEMSSFAMFFLENGNSCNEIGHWTITFYTYENTRLFQNNNLDSYIRGANYFKILAGN